MKRIRIGVAGLGRIGWHFHCRQIVESRDFDLAAVADPEAERRREAEAACGCASFSSVERMLDGAELDAAVIATPTHLHKPHALAALRKGLHVYLEKPMAMDLAEARAIVRAAARARRALSVYQPHRAGEYFQHILRIVRSGRIGRVYHVRIGAFRYVRRDDWQSLRKYGGGMLNNYGAHALDQALFMTGYDVRQVFCNLRRVAALGDSEDVVKVVYETRRGMVGEVEINQACVTNPFEFEVYGTRGVIEKLGRDLKVSSFSPRSLKPKRLRRALAGADRKYPKDDVKTREWTIPVNPRYRIDVYKDLASAIRRGTPLLVDPKETLEVMKLMDRCRKASGRIVATSSA